MAGIPPSAVAEEFAPFRGLDEDPGLMALSPEQAGRLPWVSHRQRQRRRCALALERGAGTAGQGHHHSARLLSWG